MWIWNIAKGNSELAYTMRLHAKDTLALTSCSVESNDRIFPSFPLDHSRIFDSDIYVETSKKAKKYCRTERVMGRKQQVMDASSNSEWYLYLLLFLVIMKNMTFVKMLNLVYKMKRW